MSMQTIKNSKQKRNRHIKSQVSIQYILILSVAIIVALVLFFAYNSIIGKSITKPIKNTIDYSFENIYGGNSSFTAISEVNLTKGNNYNVEVSLLLQNGTTQSKNVQYTVSQKQNITDGKYYYIFNTTKFPVLTSSVTTANAHIVFIKSITNYTSPLSNTSEQITLYNMSYYNKIPYYSLSLESVPENSGAFFPNESGYYRNGTKLSILAVNTSNYGFLRWYGIGTGSYSGTSLLASIEVDSNMTEYAYFEPRIPIEVNSNYKTNFSVNTNNFSTNSTQNFTLYQHYEISFPLSFYNKSKEVFYNFDNLSFCGSVVQGNTYSFTMSDSYTNCSFVAIYTKEYLLTLTGFNGTINTNASCSTECYLPANEKVKISGQPNTNYEFSKFVGAGANSYSGENQTANIIMTNPISETGYFVPVELIYVNSNNATKFYYNNISYQANTIIEVPQNKQFSIYSQNYKTNIPGYLYASSFERYPLIINSTESTCGLSGTTFTATNTSSSTTKACTITINQETTPQYALIFNESLNSGTQTTNQTYGNIYFSNGTQAQHINWITSGKGVSFYAMNNKAGYGFNTFTDDAGQTVDGYTLIGYSGPNEVATTPYPSSDSLPYPEIYFPTGYYCGPEISYYTEFTVSTANQAGVDLTSPAIEIANYNTNINTTSGQKNITIHYTYYDLEFTASGGTGCVNYAESLSSASVVNEGTLIYNASITSPYTNYTKGVGNYTLYNITSNLQDCTNGSCSYSYSSNIKQFKSNQFLSPEFTSTYNEINNYMDSKFSQTGNIEGDSSPAYYYTVSYWYNMSGITVYSNYISGSPSFSFSGTSTSSSTDYNLNGENLGISSVP